MSAGLSDSLAHSLALVTAEIVEDDHIAGLEGRDERLLDPGAEPFAVDGPVQNQGRGDRIAPERGDKGQGCLAPMRNLGHQPLTARSPATDAGHVGLGPSLVDEHQALGIKTVLVALPPRPLAGHVRSVLLGRVKAFF